MKKYVVILMSCAKSYTFMHISAVYKYIKIKQ